MCRLILPWLTLAACAPRYCAGYLPAVCQGTVFRAGKYPILDLATPEGVSPATQQTTLDLIRGLDRMQP
jgi:hypothetical protein